MHDPCLRVDSAAGTLLHRRTISSPPTLPTDCHIIHALSKVYLHATNTATAGTATGPMSGDGILSTPAKCVTPGKMSQAAKTPPTPYYKEFIELLTSSDSSESKNEEHVMKKHKLMPPEVNTQYLPQMDDCGDMDTSYFAHSLGKHKKDENGESDRSTSDA